MPGYVAAQDLRLVHFLLPSLPGVWWGVRMVKKFSVLAAAFSAVGVLFSLANAQGPATAAENAAPVIRSGDGGLGRDIFDKDKFSTRTIICPFKGEVSYKPGEISCGMLTVPENREKARPRAIELHFVKIAAKKPDDWNTEEKGEWIKRDDPIIYLTGGPGVKVQGYAERLKDHGVRETRDLYILEQRGIGWSGDFCPLYSLYDPAAANTPDWEQYQRARLEAMEACFAAAKAARVDLSAYSTIENARDVEALRRALEIEKWNVWGISYGSILGQAYLKQDPAGIRAAVIDAIVPLDQNITFHHIARYYDRTLNLLTDACNTDSSCAANFPNFKARLEAAIMKTSMAPIEIDALDEELFPSGKGYFFQDIIGGAPFVLFYEQDNYATLPAFIDSYIRLVEEGNFEPFRLLTSGGGGPAAFSISQGMYNAIACRDGWNAPMQKALEEDFADFPALAMVFGDPAMAAEQARICKKYGLAPRPADDYTPVNTDIRTLIVEGAMDPITPPPLAKAILPGFSNGTYVEFPYAGHGPTRSVECAGAFLTNFFDDPDGELDMSCPESMEPPEFSGRLFETNTITSLAVLASKDEKKLVTPVLWLGIPVIVMALGVLIYTLAPVARLVNGIGGHPTGGARLLAWLTSLLGAGSAGGLAYAAYASFEANQFVLLVGMLGWARWFALAGLASGLSGAVLLWQSVKARAHTPLPIGVLLGLLMTGVSGVAYAAWLIRWGLAPF
jgi:pimeloyl-ACP methyl ester carboxylesterase